ncbi:MAG TPA: DUF6580 family putative transport protein [Planctomycetaceae bacterium]|jgi:hypothetical protein|nr:DUF6580 family putative transport protein [Planctomycetaceae bacterium]
MRLPRSVVIVLLIVVPAVMRAIHFERSLVPMGALALFCGAHFRSRWLALAIPLASMLCGDVLIGLLHHDMGFAFYQLLPVVYGCYALNVLLGVGLQRYWDRLKAFYPGRGAATADRVESERAAPSVLATRVLPIAGATLGGAIIFFLVTNFADWYLYNSYAKSWQGLLDCYVAGIPFFRRGTLLADVIGAALLFGGDYLLQMHAAEQTAAERA